eukprot:9394151-Lingulodinium_polyedra.AAC.1
MGCLARSVAQAAARLLRGGTAAPLASGCRACGPIPGSACPEPEGAALAAVPSPGDPEAARLARAG